MRTMPSSTFEFNLIRTQDGAMLRTWLLRPHIAEWWGAVESIEDLHQQYVRGLDASSSRFDTAQAHVDQATAYIAKGCLAEALAAYEFVLVQERIPPIVITQAYLNLPWLVATRRLEASYDRALRVLEEYKGRLTFPVELFRWNAAKALILADRAPGSVDVKECAAVALEAAAKTSSGLRYHSKLGLVGTEYRKVTDELEKLAT